MPKISILLFLLLLLCGCEKNIPETVLPTHTVCQTEAPSPPSTAPPIREVTIGEEVYPVEITELQLSQPDPDELLSVLPLLPNVTQITMTEPCGSGASMGKLVKQYPNVQFHWQKTVWDRSFTEAAPEIDLSGIPLSVQEAKTAMEWFPTAQILNLSNCGLSCEELAQFREDMRPQYKVVWTVKITSIPVRTDAQIFHAAGKGISVVDYLSQDLIYCEDMVIVDVGHSQLTHIDWVKGMPNLKYLIIAYNPVRDISPLRDCKKLIYLELMRNPYLEDISPVTGCTALEDINLSYCPKVDGTPLAQMPWLKNVWDNNHHADTQLAQLLETALPDTHIQIASTGHNTGGWRDLKNYHDMRDLMGMPHNTW